VGGMIHEEPSPLRGQSRRPGASRRSSWPLEGPVLAQGSHLCARAPSAPRDTVGVANRLPCVAARYTASTANVNATRMSSAT